MRGVLELPIELKSDVFIWNKGSKRMKVSGDKFVTGGIQ